MMFRFSLYFSYHVKSCYPTAPNTFWDCIWSVFFGSKHLLREYLEHQGYIIIYPAKPGSNFMPQVTAESCTQAAPQGRSQHDRRSHACPCSLAPPISQSFLNIDHVRVIIYLKLNRVMYLSSLSLKECFPACKVFWWILAGIPGGDVLIPWKVTKGKAKVLQINETRACAVAVKTALLQRMRSVPTEIVVLGYLVSTSTHRNNHNIPKCTKGNHPAHFKTSTRMSASGL